MSEAGLSGRSGLTADDWLRFVSWVAATFIVAASSPLGMSSGLQGGLLWIASAVAIAWFGTIVTRRRYSSIDSTSSPSLTIYLAVSTPTLVVWWSLGLIVRGGEMDAVTFLIWFAAGVQFAQLLSRAVWNAVDLRSSRDA